MFCDIFCISWQISYSPAQHLNVLYIQKRMVQAAQSSYYFQRRCANHQVEFNGKLPGLRPASRAVIFFGESKPKLASSSLEQNLAKTSTSSRRSWYSRH